MQPTQVGVYIIVYGRNRVNYNGRRLFTEVVKVMQYTQRKDQK